MNEKQIIQEMLINESGFELFFKHFYNRIFNFILKKVRDKDIALDLTNDTFYKIYLNKEKVKVDQKYNSYFYTIAINEIRQFYRNKKEITLESETLEFLLSNIEDESIENVYQKEEMFSVLDELMNKVLNQEEILFISLKYFENKSIKEISETFAIKEGTIKSKLSRAIQKIKTELENLQPNQNLNIL